MPENKRPKVQAEEVAAPAPKVDVEDLRRKRDAAASAGDAALTAHLDNLVREAEVAAAATRVE